MENNHKSHKKNEKLDKKRKKEKELKKIKKLKKKASNLLKDSKKKDFFDQKIKREKAIKAFKKFLKIYKDDLEDFYNIFQQLDEGNVIETAEIENDNVKIRLQKLFKALKIKEKTPQTYKKTSQRNLEQYVRGMFDEVVNGVEYHSTPEESEQSSNESESEKKSIKKENKIEKKLETDTFYSQHQEQPLNRDEVRETLMTDYQKKNINKNDDEMDQFLEGQFTKIKGNKLSNYLDNRQKPITKPLVSQQDSSIYLGAQTSKKVNPDEVKEFMSWYDQQYRQKSLYEMHQEKLKASKNVQNQSKERKEFNRDTDLQHGGGQTKQQMINQIRLGGLGNKFRQLLKFIYMIKYQIAKQKDLSFTNKDNIFQDPILQVLYTTPQSKRDIVGGQDTISRILNNPIENVERKPKTRFQKFSETIKQQEWQYLKLPEAPIKPPTPIKKKIIPTLTKREVLDKLNKIRSNSLNITNDSFKFSQALNTTMRLSVTRDQRQIQKGEELKLRRTKMDYYLKNKVGRNNTLFGQTFQYRKKVEYGNKVDLSTQSRDMWYQTLRNNYDNSILDHKRESINQEFMLTGEDKFQLEFESIKKDPDDTRYELAEQENYCKDETYSNNWKDSVIPKIYNLINFDIQLQ